MDVISEVTAELADYVAGARTQNIPDQVLERGMLHTLDTLAAVVSGSQLPAVLAARRWADRSFGEASVGPCTIVGRSPGTPFAAALCNGMAAHGDETDDLHKEQVTNLSAAPKMRQLFAGSPTRRGWTLVATARQAEAAPRRRPLR